MNHASQNSGLDEKKSRRSFLNILLGSSLFGFIAAVVYPIGKYLYRKKPFQPDQQRHEKRGDRHD